MPVFLFAEVAKNKTKTKCIESMTQQLIVLQSTKYTNYYLREGE